jgi:hypothetical protein
VLGKHRLDVKSGRSDQAMTNILTAVIVDSRHVVTTLEAVGAPDIGNGRALAAAMVTTFDQIEKSDAMWRSELRAGDRVSQTAPLVKRDRFRTSIEALVLVGHQIERLPLTPERQDEMARSPVCRDVSCWLRRGGAPGGSELGGSEELRELRRS